MARADVPFGIDRTRHQDLSARSRHVWWRRATLMVIAAVPVLGLLNRCSRDHHLRAGVRLHRALGRRGLSTLQPSDFILLVVIGDLIQSGVTQNDLSVTGVLLMVCTIGILQVMFSYLGFRFRRVRPVLQGEPIVLVENGQVMDRNMRRERLTLDDLAETARLSEIESIDEVRWAVLETNGDISFIKAIEQLAFPVSQAICG